MQYDRHTYKTGHWAQREGGVRHGEEVAIQKPRRGAQDASPWASEGDSPAATAALSLRSPEPRDSSAVLSLVRSGVLWGPLEGHTASWECGHRSAVSAPCSSAGVASPPPGNSFQPRFVPADTTGTQEANECPPLQCGLTPTLLEHSFLRSQTPRPSAGVLLTPHS